jgi:hypothetical protein
MFYIFHCFCSKILHFSCYFNTLLKKSISNLAKTKNCVIFDSQKEQNKSKFKISVSSCAHNFRLSQVKMFEKFMCGPDTVSGFRVWVFSVFERSKCIEKLTCVKKCPGLGGFRHWQVPALTGFTVFVGMCNVTVLCKL